MKYYLLLRNFYLTIFLLCVLILLDGGVNSLILRGSLTTNSEWTFIGKFCFISYDSRLRFRLKYSSDFATQNLLLYYDNQWMNVYPGKGMSCQQKENQLVSGQKIPLSVSTPSLTQSLTQLCTEESNYLSCDDERGFISARARYWFAVVSRCNQTQSKGISINYDLLFTNGDGNFRHHFSADEFGILETSISMFLAYFVIMVLVSLYAKILHKKSLLHITFKLFIISVSFQFLSFLFYMSEYGQFSQSGIATPGMLTTARLFDAIAQTIFLYMLILLAKGYTVTRGKLRKITKIKLAVLFGSYIIAYIVAFIYAEVLFDPAIVNYFYDSPPVVGLICIKLVFGLAWFIYSIIFTLKNYPEKRKFYVGFLVFFTIWFISGPLVLLACSYFVSDHVKQFVSFIVQSFICLIGHSFFLFLTRPTVGNKSFPYHVRTNQIVSLVNESGSENQNFPHHTENEGGNKNFDSNVFKLDDLFSIKESGEKYQVDTTTTTN